MKTPKLNPAIFVEAAEAIFLHLSDAGQSGCCHALERVIARHDPALDQDTNAYSTPYHEFFNSYFPWCPTERDKRDGATQISFNRDLETGEAWSAISQRAYRVQALLLCAAIVEFEQAAAKRKKRSARK